MKKDASLNTMFATGMNLVENFKKKKSSKDSIEDGPHFEDDPGLLIVRNIP